MSEQPARTIAVISAVPTVLGDFGARVVGGVYALCTDGTLWWLAPERTSTWEQLPPIPQED